MLPKYNDVRSCAGHRKRPIWTPHFVDSKLGLAEFDIELTQDGEVDIFDSIQELSDYVDIDNIVKRYNNGEVDVLEKVQGFYGDLTSMPVDMRGIYDLNAKGKSLFDALPDAVRDQIGDYKSFMSLPIDKLNSIVNPAPAADTITKEVTEDAAAE